VSTVLLNACYSLSVGRLAAIGVDYTIASDGAIADPAAVEFARGFYDAVGAGLSVPDAFDEGRSCAQLKGWRPQVVLLRRGEVHVGETTSAASPARQQRHSLLVGIALDTSGSMRASIQNRTDDALTRLEAAQGAIARLGESVQSALQTAGERADAIEATFRVFAYAFGLRRGGVVDIGGLCRAAQAMDLQHEVDSRRREYTARAEREAASYGGLADLARQYLGDAVDRVAAGVRHEAGRSIRARIVDEVSGLLFSRAAAEGDVTPSAGELAGLWQSRSPAAAESIEPLNYGDTPLNEAARTLRERFQRTEPSSGTEQRILVVISDGEPTDGDPRRAFADMREAGVTIVSCFVTDQDIAEPRALVAARQPHWTAGAGLMFEIASTIDEQDPHARALLGHGWTIEPGARLFVQVNHSEVLAEFVRAIGADIFARDPTLLPEGR
jgi:hypothetical protein